jgi:hypothetical protein
MRIADAVIARSASDDLSADLSAVAQRAKAEAIQIFNAARAGLLGLRSQKTAGAIFVRG